MLSARATLTNMTRGRRARLFTRGIVIAVSIFLFSHFMQILGTSLRLPAIVAAWAPAIIVIILGAILLARMDEA
jgi:lipopolysaccharide export LptBFGC system permease protein LptF